MFQEILKSIQDKIQAQIQEKFGLNSDQTSQSTSVLLDNFKKFFSEDVMSGDFSNIKSILDNGLQSITENPTLQNFQKNVVNDLVNKVGLTDDIAQKVKDIQVNELFSSLQNELLDENGKPDFSKIMSKININELQEKAKDLLGGIDLGGLFGKK
ncbi:MAG TPA: hypothetical protein PLC61_09005 [Chitinophagales bacterium]|nr:hypothetical protein [Chitinophagales bacterium]HND46514.1 hypothetical protein [Chitinophagales bacterium]HNE85626.1 hypothetical protein [Chitinophagales bacterium]HNG07563.1 hypothetical protein [Chitinophagales bacterium]HNG25777.1 hypothetical protein [Chitinophagales bacterium]